MQAIAAPEAEGLQLHLSSSNRTGYTGVRSRNGRFQAEHEQNGRKVYLGSFDTAVQAAVAYAREVGEYQSPAVPREAEGTRLYLSSSNRTGYRGVRKTDSGRFQADTWQNGRKVYLGTFDTAVEAAVAYAREDKTQSRKRPRCAFAGRPVVGVMAA